MKAATLWFWLSASQSRRHSGCSLAWLNCSVLWSAPAGPLALVPVNPAVHRSLLGNFQGTVEACQHPLLFQHTCIHTLFNSSAQNTRGWKKESHGFSTDGEMDRRTVVYAAATGDMKFFCDGGVLTIPGCMWMCFKSYNVLNKITSALKINHKD